MITGNMCHQTLRIVKCLLHHSHLIKRQWIKTWYPGVKPTTWKEEKNISKYTIFSWLRENFSIKLSLKNQPLDRAQDVVYLLVRMAPSLTWEKHIAEICRRAYPQIRMLTKLKYVCTKTEDLIELYCSIIEYSSTAFHSTLIQKIS